MTNKRILRTREEEFSYDNSFGEDLVSAIILVLKIILFPIYFVILFYRNVSALWSDQYIADQIKDCKKNAKERGIVLSDEFVLKHIRGKGIYSIDKKDIRLVMKIMKSQEIEGCISQFFQLLFDKILFNRKDYCTLKLA